MPTAALRSIADNPALDVGDADLLLFLRTGAQEMHEPVGQRPEPAAERFELGLDHRVAVLVHEREGVALELEGAADRDAGLQRLIAALQTAAEHR